MPVKISNTQIVGFQFGRLTPVQEVYGRNGRYFKCRCVCGKFTVSRLDGLRNGTAQSCGCYTVERTIETHTTHGMSRHPLYTVWANMWKRCVDKRNDHYHNYGGRNIKVCKAWSNRDTFFNWAKPRWKPGLELERVDNDGDYKPSNCKFVTPAINSNNTRRNVNVSVKGVSYTLAQASKKFGVPYYKLYDRYVRLGWRIEDAVQ